MKIEYWDWWIWMRMIFDGRFEEVRFEGQDLGGEMDLAIAIFKP